MGQAPNIWEFFSQPLRVWHEVKCFVNLVKKHIPNVSEGHGDDKYLYYKQILEAPVTFQGWTTIKNLGSRKPSVLGKQPSKQSDTFKDAVYFTIIY